MLPLKGASFDKDFYLKALTPYLLLTLLCLGLYLPGLSTIPVVDRDEPHFAQTSRQLLETGSYLRLKFQNQDRHLKPPGAYWLQAAAASFWGNVDHPRIWPYRLPSFLGMVLAVLFCYRGARTLLGEQIALLGSALLASSLLVVVEAHLVSTDALLLLSVVLMQGSLWKIYVDSRAQKTSSASWAVLFWLAMAFGVFIKGISPLFAVLTLLGLWVADKKLSCLKALCPQWGLPLLLIVTALWLVPVSLASGSNFLWDMIRLDILPKLAGGQQSHGQPPGYFLLSSLVTLWPASLLWVGAGCYAWTQRKRVDIRFLMAWIIPCFLVYECVPTKLPEYLMPIYPAIALLMAAAVYDQKAIALKFNIITRLFYMLWLGLSLSLAFLIIFIPYWLEHTFLVSAGISSALILIGSVFAVSRLWVNKTKQAAIALVFTALLSLPWFLEGVIPQLKSVWLTERIAQTLAAQNPRLDAQHPLLALDYQEPSLVFSLGAQQVLFTDLQTTVEKLKVGANWALVEKAHQTQFEQQLKQASLKAKVVNTFQGYQYNGGHWVHLMLYKKE